MKKITLLMMLAAMLTNGWAQDFLITTYQDCKPAADAVDLGLPSGLKWATCNVGAANPWDYGDYFAWGETVSYGKSDPSNARNYAYSHSYVKTYCNCYTYKYCNGSYNTLTKYNTKRDYGSVVDRKNTLDLADDAARANMGGSWRMPTAAEQQELIDNCYWEWTDSYNGKGVKGYIVYKVKNNSDKGKKKYGGSSTTTTVGSYSLDDPHIFLPAAGYRSGFGLNYGLDLVGVEGYYWSSSLDTDYPYKAYRLNFYSPNNAYKSVYDRCQGVSVRGVIK